MPDSVIRITDQIIGTSLIGVEALLDSLRDTIERELNHAPNEQILLGTLRAILERNQPMLIDHLRDTDLAAWVAGLDTVYKQFPSWLIEEFQTSIRGLPPAPPPPPSRFNLFDMFGDEPRLRFPLIEEAAAKLEKANILTRDEWDRAAAQAKANAFTITGDLTADTIEKVRNELVTDIEQGTSFQSFKNRVGGLLETSGIGPGRIETIYRQNVQTAFTQGKEQLADNPVVRDLFPYQAYLAIKDARSRHFPLESLGLNGTNVYRRDDPFWRTWLPPCDYNCRCGYKLMTVESAARAGVEEAKRWLESGRPPQNPEWRYQYIPEYLHPSPTYVNRGALSAA